MPPRIESPFSFRLAEKKTAIHGQKKRRCIQPCTCVQGWGNGFCENCCASEEISTKSRAECGFYPTLYAMLTVTSILGLQRGHPLLLFSLPLPRPTPGGVSKGEGPCPRPPSPWGLVSKGGGQGPRPLCRFKGVRGEIEIPPRFSLGGPGGHSLFKREYPPGFSVPKRYSSAGNSGPMWERHITPARRTAPRCCCP